MSEAYGTRLARAVRDLIDYEGRWPSHARDWTMQLERCVGGGAGMSSEQAIEYAPEQEPDSEPPALVAYPAGLSDREAEVLRLVATG